MTIPKGLDVHSPTWQAITKYAAERLAAVRATVEAEGTDLATTENARGRIAELKNLLALAVARPEIPGGPGRYDE